MDVREANLFGNLAQYKKLTKDEEFEAYDQIQKGDKAAGRKVVQSCIPWAIKRARYWHGRQGLLDKEGGILLDDLIGWAALGLSEAVSKWNPEKGRFTTYCTVHIDRRCREALCFRENMIQTPACITYRKGREKAPAHLREAVEKTNHVTLVGHGGRGRDSRRYRGFTAPDNTEQTEQQEHTAAIVADLMRYLNERDRDIIEMCSREVPLRSIAKMFGISSTRVGQLKFAIQKKLRKIAKQKGFTAYAYRVKDSV